MRATSSFLTPCGCDAAHSIGTPFTSGLDTGNRLQPWGRRGRVSPVPADRAPSIRTLAADRYGLSTDQAAVAIDRDQVDVARALATAVAGGEVHPVAAQVGTQARERLAHARTAHAA